MFRDLYSFPARRLIFCAFLSVVSGVTAYAQEFRGGLSGRVQDSSGARVVAAKIEIQAPESSVQRETRTDSEGNFRLVDLPAGRYQLTVNAKGFAPATSEVAVQVGSTRDLLVTLRTPTVRESVAVSGEASSITMQPLDTTSAVHQSVISSHDLRELPLANRSFANIAYLAPGTQPIEPSDPTKARITAVGTGGSSGLNNENSVDGGDNSDDYIGGFLQNFSPDAIEEFAFRTAQEDADTGHTTAGSVVISTKRGSNAWHGLFGFYDRTAALNARLPIDNPEPNPKQPFSRENYIFNAGGPIKKDKLWVFGSLEYVRERASIAYSNESQLQFNALGELARAGYIPGVPDITVPPYVVTPFNDYLGDLRFDWSQSRHSQWFLRGASDRYKTKNDLVQQATLPSTGATTRSLYWNFAVNNQFEFSTSWLGSFTFDASLLHRTVDRNQYYGFALDFPFTVTPSVITGQDTFGDNTFVTPITAFPVLRNQQKYQFRYDLSHVTGRHSWKFGANFIHEPVLDGVLASNAETVIAYTENPDFYAANPSAFAFTPTYLANPDACNANQRDPNTLCTFTPAGDGSFAQNVQRLGLYAEDIWRITSHLTLNYGLRWDTTYGLFDASGRSQSANVALQGIAYPQYAGVPHDYREQFGPRIGLIYSPGTTQKTVLRAGFGIFYNDLAQNGWVQALQAVNNGNANLNSTAAIIDPNYHSPYAIHVTAGVEHAFDQDWMGSLDYTHETGMHGYRRYDYPDVSVFRSDNRSVYDGLTLRVQGNVSKVFSMTAHYTLSKAQTWGCQLGELFDYVNGVCDPSNAFGPGDYGPSGEDARHRFVLAGTYHAPLGLELSTLSQVESARPFTMTNADGSARAVINGVETTMDQFRGRPYFQVDLRVSRPFILRDRWQVLPFFEMFNLLNRNNPGAFYRANIADLPVNNVENATAICLNPDCTQTTPITNPNQLRIPAGAFGDFFGPGTTVGVPFSAQFGVRVSF
jgi:Carboxypeptidase regulatory-like domain/TonB dependent receptor